MRASDHRRAETVAELRERALDGCLTLDTFASRVEAAYRAKSEDELEVLVADLPARRDRLRAVRDAVRRVAHWLVATRPRPDAPALQIEVSLPRSVPALTVGRSRECDVVVGERTVSRVHAELRHDDDDSWIVRDLGSTNGTWLNGSQVCEARVSRGDVLRLGGLRMELRL